MTIRRREGKWRKKKKRRKLQLRRVICVHNAYYVPLTIVSSSFLSRTLYFRLHADQDRFSRIARKRLHAIKDDNRSLRAFFDISCYQHWKNFFFNKIILHLLLNIIIERIRVFVIRIQKFELIRSNIDIVIKLKFIYEIIIFINIK